MKRSEINRHIQEFLDFAEAQRFFFPPWALYTPEQWSRIGPEADEIRRARLGWDVTDFRSGQFHRIGLTLFLPKVPDRPLPPHTPTLRPFAPLSRGLRFSS